jgi:eukaryotic-like serine/threonine-protein kinase
MAVTPGSRVGSFEIRELIGTGGMGEVYRAHDPRLGRDVAIKVIPASFAADADRLRRFEQEARAAAALTHPNILAVHDVGTHQSAPYIVSELLTGMTLRERMGGGAMPVRKAIDIGVQIARGLAAAHQKNIVHRDLKPENVFVTDEGLVKILDFGLAKLTEVEVRPAEEALTRQADTQPGSVMGTAGYMSPEQLRAQPVDARSDIFSFGAVMHELLAGVRAFRGDTAMDVATAILKEDPPTLASADRSIPPALARIVERCLEKHAAARFQSAGDLAFALEALSSPSGQTQTLPAAASPRRRAMPWPGVAALGLAAGIAATYGAMTIRRPAAPASEAISFPLTLPDGVVLVGGGPTGSSPAPIAVSPDGRHIALIGVGTDNVRKIWVRSRASVSPRVLPGTDGALSPFWSPDSQQIAFYVPSQPGKLKRVAISGGLTADICEVRNPVGGSWNADGVIIFGVNVPGTGIQRVPATGGTPTAVTTVTEGEGLHLRPLFLPDGKRFVFRVGRQNNARGQVFLASLDSPDRVHLVDTESSNTAYSAGHLLYLRGSSLVAHPFSEAAGKVAGEAFPIVDGVQAYGGVPSGVFTASLNGVLAYQPGSAAAGSELRWFSRTGTRGDRLGDTGSLADVRLSRDDSRAAYSRRGDGPDATSDIWIVDTATKLANRFTFDGGNEQSAVFSPDGREVIFNSSKKGRLDLYRKPADGSGAEIELLADESDKGPVDWSPDGKHLLYIRNATFTDQRASTGGRGGGSGGISARLWVLPLEGNRTPFPLNLDPKALGETPGGFSPDGRFVVYASNDGDATRVYVSPFPPTGTKWQISLDRGGAPRWSSDGKEIFYVSPGPSQLMAARVDATGAGVKRLEVKTLFPVTFGGPRRPFEPSKDGQRFLINTSTGGDTVAGQSAVVVIDWPALRQNNTSR